MENILSNITKQKRMFLESPHIKRSLYQYVESLESNQNYNEIVSAYRMYLESNNHDAESWFNLGYYLRKSLCFKDAVVAYEKALALSINMPEEVLTNIATIYSEDLDDCSNAVVKLKEAVDLNSLYVPAIYNLANLYENTGELEKAIELFYRALSLQPNFIDCYCRLVLLDRKITLSHRVTLSLREFSINPKVPIGGKVACFYALANVAENDGNYYQAFEYLKEANRLNQNKISEYEPNVEDRLIDKYIGLFNSLGCKTTYENSSVKPVFICGMFRSGTTLVEQALAGHSNLRSGGELEYFFREFDKGEPEALIAALQNKDAGRKLADGYMNYLNERFNANSMIIDKRPDNFYYFGLISKLFPNAKFICTDRHILDNALSVYSLQLGPKMNYATNLNSIIHFHLQYKKLLKHWISLFPEQIYVIKYENLVRNPELELKKVLAFLGLTWEPSCLDFHKSKGFVKTASSVKIRQPINDKSINRWLKFENELRQEINDFDQLV